MKSKHPVLHLLHGQLFDWLHSSRTWISVCLIVSISYMTAKSYLYMINTSELYAYFGETLYYFLSMGFGNMVMTSAIFLVMVSEIPRFIQWQNFALIRTKRRQWLNSQFLFCFIIVVLMIGMLILFVSVIVGPSMSSGTGWSDEERAMQSGYEGDMMLVETFIRQISPMQACLYSAMVLFFFWFTMTLVILYCSISGHPSLGIIMYSVILYLNVILLWEMLPAWMHWMPVQFSTFINIASTFPEHELPAVQISCGVYLLIDLILMYLMHAKVRHVDLTFTE